MIDAWLVVREQNNIDTRHIVCLEKVDAITIATDMSTYWMSEYGLFYTSPGIDCVQYGNVAYSVKVEDLFWIRVEPIRIREDGEIKQHD